jgi:exopolyphosphatase/guanosine-5'-triphosphate,3'-diphosphate pyrophosphatase
MRLACIDIGTNTTRLLVAEADGQSVREVLALREFSGLGTVGPAGTIDAERIEAVAVAVADQARSARAAGARRIRAVATAGVRDATNAAALLDAVARASGLQATVLSGVEEARLAFAGATRSARLLAPTEVVGVADVGGGSTELVVGTPAGGVHWSVSLPVGSAVLGASCPLSDPPSHAELDVARERVEEAFAGVRPPPSARCLAVGGSATSLWRLVGQPLDAGALGRALDRLTASPSSEVARQMDLDPRRARLLPAGILVLERALRALGGPLHIGSGGVREGVILEELTGM